MSLERRLNSLEARTSGTQRETPPEVRVLLKAVERHRAHVAGEEPPPYSQGEIEALHAEDLETVAGRGVVGQLRSSEGWSSPEALDRLDEWEEGARRRVEQTKDLPPERWGEVYEHDDEEPDDE